jgi:hypothetical protein
LLHEATAEPGVVPGQVSRGSKKEKVNVMVSKGKSSQAALVKEFIAGVNKHFPNGSQQLQVGGATFTVTGLTTLLQGFVDTREAVEASQAATRAKVRSEDAQLPSQRAMIHALETTIRGTFGNSADVLGDFGLAPLKAHAPRTAEQKAVAAAKAAATRKARGTMGKNQKKNVKGSITAKLVVTPVMTSPVSTPVDAPAPTTGAPGAATAGASPTGNTPTGVTPATAPPRTA